MAENGFVECSVRLARYFPDLQLLVARFRGTISPQEWVEFWLRTGRRMQGSRVERSLVDVRGCDALDPLTIDVLADRSEWRDMEAQIAFLVDPDGLDMIDAVIASRSGEGTAGTFIICDSLADASAFLDVELEPMLENLAQMESWRTL